MNEKQERAKNFTRSEVRLLVELVTKFKSIIENKKTDAITNKDKECAWCSIATTFNAASSGTAVRTAKTLKLKYESIKKETKKKMTLHRQDLYKTGGGPSAAPDFDSVEEKLLAICSNISGLEARNDSDNITGVDNSVMLVPEVSLLETQEDFFITEEMQLDDVRDKKIDVVVDDNELNKSILLNTSCNIQVTEDLVVDVNDVNKSSTLNSDGDIQVTKDFNNKWKTWHPKLLKSKVTPALKRPTKNSVTAKLDELSATRLELVKLQLEIAKKEHMFVKEEHEAKMANLHNEEVRKQELHQLMLEKLSVKN